jgi:2-oxoglutarate ferredoxin oxidoreductase subunit beta
MGEAVQQPKLTKKDFATDQEVRWCPGCGDYAILSAVQSVFPELGIPKENFVIVSGIGCSSRFPYYMNTYGFHTIHGRAPAVATGVKVANPELDVWIVTGDGDSLSIGGNHLLHILRRNLDVNILMFNNEIYGLTKGQYSPTSPVGTRKKSTPMGSIDRPFEPVQFALGAQATFVARTIDQDQKHLTKVLNAAAAHKGTSFIEILQNCVIFNKDFYNDTVAKPVRADQTVTLTPGEKVVYGKEKDKGLRITTDGVVACSVEEADVWDPTNESAGPAFAYSHLDAQPEMPQPLGIFRSIESTIYEEGVNAQVEAAIAKKGEGKLEDLVFAGERWKIG